MLNGKMSDKDKDSVWLVSKERTEDLDEMLNVECRMKNGKASDEEKGLFGLTVMRPKKPAPGYLLFVKPSGKTACQSAYSP